MRTQNRLRFGASTVVVGMLVVTAVAGGLFGQIGVAAMLMVLALVIFAVVVERYVWVRVPEMQTLIIFHRERQAFVRFVEHNGGRRHLLNVPLEYVKARISTMPSSVQGRCAQAQTHGGVSVDLSWSVTYQLQPEMADSDVKPIVARLVQGSLNHFFKKHVVNCLQAIVGQFTVADLSGPTVLLMLEKRLHHELAGRLRPFGMRVFRVMVTGLSFPPHVTQALEEARERELYAESEARMLERLQQALSQFTDEEMERLLRLQQVRQMGKHGVSLHVPWMPFTNTVIQQEREQRAGGKQTGNSRHAADRPFPPASDSDGPERRDWPPSV